MKPAPCLQAERPRRTSLSSRQSFTESLTASPATSLRGSCALRSGEEVACAEHAWQVEAAWRLVHDCYVRRGLIPPHPLAIHAPRSAIGPHACVLGGPTWDRIEHTMTLFQDTAHGLALEGVYPRRLDAMRTAGRRLIEVGMLASHSEHDSGTLQALFGMMRWAVHHGLHSGATDIIVGVHPHHAPFYMRRYGFEVFGPEAAYPLVQGNLVVGLRLRLREALGMDRLPRGLADAMARPVPASAFANRFSFERRHMRGSALTSVARGAWMTADAIAERMMPGGSRLPSGAPLAA